MGKPLKLTDQNKAWATRSPKERPFEVRPIRERILIVCEGSKTEPNYFESIKGVLPQQIANVIDVDGQGYNTQSLVNRARTLRADAADTDYPYDEVWVVFDRDSFSPDAFDNAIHSAEAAVMKAAWSNEAFELWYILHFEARQTGMSRTEYKACLTGHLKSAYQKNDPDMYAKLARHGQEPQAMQRAIRLRQVHADVPDHQANPCTRVDELVSRLNAFRRPV